MQSLRALPLSCSRPLSRVHVTPFRSLATAATAPAQPAQGRKEGDISSVFASLSGNTPEPLPERFADIKRSLIASAGPEAIKDSFVRLLRAIKPEIEEIAARGPSIIPAIDYDQLKNPPTEFLEAHKKHGVALIRNAVPEGEAKQMLTDARKYIAANRDITKAFPANRPAVYELYWSPSQVRARAHPRLLETQRFLLQQWHAGPASTSTSDPLSLNHPVTYADRIRIRPPGDAGFALGPHVDGGSLERWEPDGYARGDVYGHIFAGAWERHDPFCAAARLRAVNDLYAGPGNCSMFRAYQGWLALGPCAPGHGTLLVNPLFARATAYYLLRPFFRPKVAEPGKEGFLHEDNWVLQGEEGGGGGVTTEIQGAFPGCGQELNDAWHPHLELGKSMVHIPQVRAGDYIAWHCDTIHAVDGVHRGTEDASVVYIPACPLTEANAEYLVKQRETFLNGFPGPDFPGGKGESEHIGRAIPELFAEGGGFSAEAARAMGLQAWDVSEAQGEQEKMMLKKANELLGF